ncbi:transcription factor s-II (TFIIS), central domain-containing protein [Ditylenchus destructor]|nr:transcription factor s-II (TFIIS), central domain-containing protein [Ditylenchus destructor]
MENWDDDEPATDCFLSTAMPANDATDGFNDEIVQHLEGANCTLETATSSSLFPKPPSEETLNVFEVGDFGNIPCSSNDLLSQEFYDTNFNCTSATFSHEPSISPQKQRKNEAPRRRFASRMFHTQLKELVVQLDENCIKRIADAITYKTSSEALDKSKKKRKNESAEAPKSNKDRLTPDKAFVKTVKPVKSSDTTELSTLTDKPLDDGIKLTPALEDSMEKSEKRAEMTETAVHSTTDKESSTCDAVTSAPEENELSEEDKKMLFLHGFKSCYISTNDDLTKIYDNEIMKASAKQVREERQKRRPRDNSHRLSTESARKRKSRRRSSNSLSRSLSPVASTSASSVSGAPNVGAQQKEHKKRLSSQNPCCMCKKTVDVRYSNLAENSAFCSIECISAQVRIARQCVRPGEAVMLMNLDGMLLNESKSPKLEALEEFLQQYPNFTPVLNTSKIEGHDLNDTKVDSKAEQKRIEVRKVIEYQLQMRSKSAKITFSKNRLKKLCIEIEEELFRMHKEVGTKYRNWCRGLLQKIKADDNIFFRKIVYEKISVKKLVTMSPEDMYTPSGIIQPIKPAKDQATENDKIERTHDSQSNNSAENAKQITGEKNAVPVETTSATTTALERPSENISPGPQIAEEDDDFSSELRSNTSKYTMVKKSPLSTVKVPSAVDNILDDTERDTTMRHNSHLYDVNCSICKEKTKADFAAKERLEAKLLSGKNRAEDEPRAKVPRFPNLDAANKAADERKERNQRYGQQEMQPEAPLYATPAPLDGAPATTDESHEADEYMDTGFHDDDYIDGSTGPTNHWESGGEIKTSETSLKSLEQVNDASAGNQNRAITSERHSTWDKRPANVSESKLPEPVSVASINKSSTEIPSKGESWKKLSESVSSSTEENPWKSDNHKIWSGTLTWGRKFEFPCSFTAVSNKTAFKLGKELPPAAKVVGRIEPVQVWTYIRSLRGSWAKQVIVLLIDPPSEKIQRANYDSCYELMRSENKYGVIEFARHATIKDGYIFALEPFEPLPKDLFPLEGPGLPDGAELNGNIILVLIKKMEKKDAQAQRSQKSDTWRTSKNLPLDTQKTSTDDNANKSCETTPNNSQLQESSCELERVKAHEQSVDYMHKDVVEPNHVTMSKSPPAISTTSDKESGKEELAKTSADYLQTPEFNSLDELLQAIAVTEKPANIVILVGAYLNRRPDVSEEERAIIKNVIMEKSEAERLRNQRNLTGTTLRKDNTHAEESSSRTTSASIYRHEETNDESSYHASPDARQIDSNANNFRPNLIRKDIIYSVRCSSRDSGHSSSNDSICAQQISFGSAAQADARPSSSVLQASTSMEESEASPDADVYDRTETPPPPPPLSTPPSSVLSPPPPPVQKHPTPVPPPIMPNLCLPTMFPPPPPAPNGSITGSKKSGEDMDISSDDDTLSTQLLPPPPPPPKLSQPTTLPIPTLSNQSPSSSGGFTPLSHSALRHPVATTGSPADISNMSPEKSPRFLREQPRDPRFSNSAILSRSPIHTINRYQEAAPRFDTRHSNDGISPRSAMELPNIPHDRAMPSDPRSRGHFPMRGGNPMHPSLPHQEGIRRPYDMHSTPQPTAGAIRPREAILGFDVRRLDSITSPSRGGFHGHAEVEDLMDRRRMFANDLNSLSRMNPALRGSPNINNEPLQPFGNHPLRGIERIRPPFGHPNMRMPGVEISPPNDSFNNAGRMFNGIGSPPMRGRDFPMRAIAPPPNLRGSRFGRPGPRGLNMF